MRSIDRRRFLKSAAAGAAVVAAKSSTLAAQDAQQAEPPRNATAPVVSRDAATGRAPVGEAATTDRPGSDFMVEVLKSLNNTRAALEGADVIVGSEQNLIDIHAYLRSVPASPAAKTIPLLNQ